MVQDSEGNPDTMQVADEAGLELERQEILAAQVPNAAIAMAVFEVVINKCQLYGPNIYVSM